VNGVTSAGDSTKDIPTKRSDTIISGPFEGGTKPGQRWAQHDVRHGFGYGYRCIDHNKIVVSAVLP